MGCAGPAGVLDPRGVARVSLAKESLESEALLVRRVPLGDADDIVHLFSEQLGAVAAIARGARRSSRRFAGLEPMHLLHARLELVPGRELATLTDVSLRRPRVGLISRLAAMQAAGQALRWLRLAAPARTPEPGLWRAINELLDGLDAGGDPSPGLAATGLKMLAEAGWGLELGRCVRCETPCPARARTTIDVRAGGVVCRTCGGFGRSTSAAQRAALEASLAGGAFTGEAASAIELVDAAFVVHGRGEGT